MPRLHARIARYARPVGRAARRSESGGNQQRELEDQYTMRFSNAGGRNAPESGPWYASKRAERESMDFVEGKDVWGRPDPAAKDREHSRRMTNDPLAFMQQAQAQLMVKQAEQDKIAADMRTREASVAEREVAVEKHRAAVENEQATVSCLLQQARAESTRPRNATLSVLA